MYIKQVSKSKRWGASFRFEATRWNSSCQRIHRVAGLYIRESETAEKTKERQEGWAEDVPAKIYELSVTLIRIAPAVFISRAEPESGHWPAVGQPTNQAAVTTEQLSSHNNDESKNYWRIIYHVSVILAVFSLFWNVCVPAWEEAFCFLVVIIVKRKNSYTRRIETVWRSTVLFQQ